LLKRIERYNFKKELSKLSINKHGKTIRRCTRPSF